MGPTGFPWLPPRTAPRRPGPRAAPRWPRWFGISIGIGALLALVAGGRPSLHVAGVVVGVGALGEWARATSLAAVVLVAAALVSWTTQLGAVAPALRRLGAPFTR